MKSQKIATRTFGIFFLLAFVSYGFGSGLVDSMVSTTDSPANINANGGNMKSWAF